MPHPVALSQCRTAMLLVAAVSLAGCAMDGPPTSGKAFRDCADCPEMLVVPAGSFTMGSPESAPVRDSDEGPERQVTLARPFAVAKFETTRAQYRAFIAATGHTSVGTCAVRVGEKVERLAGKSWQDPNIPQEDSHPVVCVSWMDAQAYAAWVSTKSGQRYRLLSEAEWEYAARAGGAGSYSFGDDTREICKHGNVADEAAKKSGMGEAWPYVDCNDGYGRSTAPVGSFQANGFGLHDMYGNGWEWVEDCYRDTYADAPKDGSPVVATDCKLRIDRGGGWYNNRGTNRSAERASYPPAAASSNITFRLARDLG